MQYVCGDIWFVNVSFDCDITLMLWHLIIKYLPSSTSIVVYVSFPIVLKVWLPFEFSLNYFHKKLFFRNIENCHFKIFFSQVKNLGRVQIEVLPFWKYVANNNLYFAISIGRLRLCLHNMVVISICCWTLSVTVGTLVSVSGLYIQVNRCSYSSPNCNFNRIWKNQFKITFVLPNLIKYDN